MPERSASFVLVLAVIGALGSACGGKAPLAPVGTSTASPRGTGARSGAPSGAVGSGLESPVPDDYRTRFAKVKGPFVSAGHASGRWRAQVYANEAGVRALDAGLRDADVSAVLVMEHTPVVGDGTGPRYVMEKRPAGYAPSHGDWRYLAFGSEGQLVADGAVDGCAGCHDAAPGDRLFAIVP